MSSSSSRGVERVVEGMVPEATARRREHLGGSRVLLPSARTMLGHTKMRLVLALIIIVYLVGVGVVLSPVVRSTWNAEPASALAQSVAQTLPDALAWPVRAARSVTGS